MRPTISVIIPFYNDGEIVNRAVSSTLSQTGDFDIEVVIVDDGSTFDHADILRRIAEQQASIKLIQKENGGLSSARNAGIAAARGDYFHFLDADDHIGDGVYSSLLAALQPGERSIAYCGVEIRDHASGLNSRAEPEPLHPSPLEALSRVNQFAVHAALVPRSLIAKVGPFDERLNACEDWDLWVRAAAAGYAFIPVKGTTVIYERRISSMSRSFRRTYSACRIVAQRGSQMMLERMGRVSPVDERFIRAWMFDFCCAPALRGRLSRRELGVIQSLLNLSLKNPVLVPEVLRFMWRNKRLLIRCLT